MTKSKEKLLKLEKSGKYLFHGTAKPNLKVLESRQGYRVPPGIIAKGREDLIKDGDPAVSATPHAEIAIFRAIIQKGRSGFGAQADGTLNFRASQQALDAKGSIGYVYVFDKKDFVPYSGHQNSMEWRSYKSAVPLKNIKVTYEDLPRAIRIIKETE